MTSVGIRKLPSGRYWVRLQLAPGKTKGFGTYDTVAEASAVREAALRKLEEQHELGVSSLIAWGYEYIERRKLAGYRTVYDMKDIFETHIKPHAFAKGSIENIRRKDVLAWVRKLMATEALVTKGAKKVSSGRKLSRQRVVNCLGVLRLMLSAAADEEMIPSNPAADVHVPKAARARTDEDWTFLMPEEQVALVRSVPPPLRYMVQFAMCSGLRQGELHALELDCVHINPPSVFVRYGGPNRRPPKNGRTRHVLLIPSAQDALGAWLKALPLYALHNPKKLVFPTPRGRQRGKKAPKGWRTWLEAAKIKRHFRWHDLRHTCGTSLLAGFWGLRWSLTDIRDLLGHSSVTVTERYAHRLKLSVADAVSAMNVDTLFRGEKT